MVAAGDLAVSLEEVQAFLRIDGGDEEATIAALIRSATSLCEQFIGQLLIERAVEERIRAGGEWARLRSAPVTAMTAVSAVGPEGIAEALPADAFAVDIDSSGYGWVRLIRGAGPTVLKVDLVAGMAADWNGLPEPIRQGIVRLAAHMFNHRDGEGGEPPAAVTALWRPYRRMRLR